MSDLLDTNPDDVYLSFPEFHAQDMYAKVGGFRSKRKIGTTVDSVFLPGSIVDPDSSESSRIQYRKLCLYNSEDNTFRKCKLFGYNVKNNSIIKFALEKGLNGYPLLNSSEAIKNYRTSPHLYSEYDFTEISSEGSLNFSDLGPGDFQGVWLKQECLKDMSEDSSDHFKIGFMFSEGASEAKYEYDVYHTRLKRFTTIVKISKDQYNPMQLIIDFEYTTPNNYFKRDEDIEFGLYLDREFLGEFFGHKTKVQLLNVDAVSIVDIFAHPHAGFAFERSHLIPGNKIKIVFKAKAKDVGDVIRHRILWDQGTGSYQTKIMGEVDAETADVTGRFLKSGRLLQE